MMVASIKETPDRRERMAEHDMIDLDIDDDLNLDLSIEGIFRRPVTTCSFAEYAMINALLRYNFRDLAVTRVKLEWNLVKLIDKVTGGRSLDFIKAVGSIPQLEVITIFDGCTTEDSENRYMSLKMIGHLIELQRSSLKEFILYAKGCLLMVADLEQLVYGFSSARHLEKIHLHDLKFFGTTDSQIFDSMFSCFTELPLNNLHISLQTDRHNFLRQMVSSLEMQRFLLVRGAKLESISLINVGLSGSQGCLLRKYLQGSSLKYVDFSDNPQLHQWCELYPQLLVTNPNLVDIGDSRATRSSIYCPLHINRGSVSIKTVEECVQSLVRLGSPIEKTIWNDDLDEIDVPLTAVYDFVLKNPQILTWRKDREK